MSGYDRGIQDTPAFTSVLQTSFMALSIVSVVLGGHASADESPLPDRGISAHRGASRTHPENTLAAICEAVRLGAHQIEIDIRCTADGKLVLMHDANLTRTTNATSLFADRESYDVSSFTLAELKRLDAGQWKHTRFATERIPTFEEAVQAIPKNTWINVDVKGGRELGKLAAQEVVRLRCEHQAFLSVRGDAVGGAREVIQATGVKLLLNNMNRRPTHMQYIDETIAGKYDFIQLIGDPFPQAEGLQRLKEADIRINHCCTNSPEQVRTWIEAGIDFPLVDDVAMAIAVCKQLGITPLNERP